MGQKQRDKKLKKLAEKKKIAFEIKERKKAKFTPIKKKITRIAVALVSIAVISVGIILIRDNMDYIKGKLPFGKTKTASQDYGVIETGKGKIVFELFTNDAPKTVENFEGLSSKKYFDGLKFHRVVPEFVIQGGDPKGDGTGGESLWGGKFADEINPKSLGLTSDKIKENEKAGYKYNYKLKSHKMVVGSVAMANSGPNSNGSQFFIVTTKDQPDLDGKYTVFGQVVEGMDVVKNIAQGDTMNKVYVLSKENYDLSKTK